VRIVVSLLAGICICTSVVQGENVGSTSQPAAEAWASRPPAQWPQLVLTNKASFGGHTPLEGASAFLMRMADGQVLLGTAKHLIGNAGGVNPPIPLPDLDHALKQWKVFPRTRENEAIEVGGLAITPNGAAGHDWLLLQLRDPKAKLPAMPLVPRLRPAGVGEIVYLVGVPYSDQRSAQKVYTGIVTGRPRKNYFTYEFTPPVHISGFSGAPIVDSHGLLLGHGVSMGTTLKQKDGMEVEFGGEDAALAVKLWEHRSDPPPVNPAEVIHVNLPPGWIRKASKSPKVLAFGENPSMLAFFEVIAEPRAQFDSDVDLMAWARLVKGNTTRISVLTDRHETDLKPGRIGGQPTVEYEISGRIRNIALRYRMIMLEQKGCFVKVACWTTPAHWDEAQPEFEKVVDNLRNASR
jgi:hypothetical protein